MKRSLLAFCAGVCLVGALLSACGGSGQAKESKAEAQESVKEGDKSDYAGMKIVLILPGSIDDQSWNASNNAGAKQCDKELGTKIEVVESVPVEEFEQTFTEYGEKGYDLVMSAGSQFD